MQDGPLFETRTSHVPDGMLKRIEQAALRFGNVNSTNGHVNHYKFYMVKGNKFSSLTRPIRLLSGSDESF